MEYIIRFVSTLIVLFIIVTQNTESAPKLFLRLSSLCPSNKYSNRLVKTPYGLRCLSTKRLTEKRSPPNSEFSSLESQLSDSYDDKYPVSVVDQEINSVTPTMRSVPTTRYKKVIIKNNRGPWKIANQIFERSPHRRRPPVGFNYEEELAEYQLTSRSPSRSHKKIGLRKNKSREDHSPRDGLLVNQQIVRESFVKIPKLVVGSWMKIPEPSDESLFSSSSLKTTTKIPYRTSPKSDDKKNLKPNNLKSFKFKSDVEVLDLMEVDSVINSSFKRNNSTKLVDDKRKTGSPLVIETNPLTLPEISGHTKITPIKIFVFLNHNQTIDSITESSDRYEIGERLQSPSGTSTELTASSTTNSVTAPPTIGKELKKLDLDEFIEKIDGEEGDGEDSTDGEVEDKSSGDEISTTSSIPISRNWNFVCGKKKGFFADVENDCRTYYQCSVRGRQRFECPPGTKFNQDSSICDWIENVSCLKIEDKSLNHNNSTDDHVENTSENPLLLTTSTLTSTSTSEPDEYEDSTDDE